MKCLTVRHFILFFKASSGRELPSLEPLIVLDIGVTWWIIGFDDQGMKIDRHGQAKILTQSEIQLLFSQGLQTDRDRDLFG